MIPDCYPLYYPFQTALAVFRPPVKENLTELERACRDRRTGSADFLFAHDRTGIMPPYRQRRLFSGCCRRVTSADYPLLADLDQRLLEQVHKGSYGLLPCRLSWHKLLWINSVALTAGESRKEIGMDGLKQLSLALATAGLLVIGISTPATAQSYKFTDLGTLGGSYSTATAINNSGQIAGWSAVPGNSAYHATLWNGTTATDLGTLGGSSGNSLANAINSAGQVVGWSNVMDTADYHATLWNGTVATDLGGGNSTATAINNAGQIVGYSSSASAESVHATIWNGSATTDLGVLRGSYSTASAINDSGQVAGASYVTDSPNYHAIVWNGAVATDLSGGSFSSALAINNAGQIAGYAWTADNTTYHATLWNGTTATDLGTLGGNRSVAFAINNAGQVVGYSTTLDNAKHATIWNGSSATNLNSFLDASTTSAGWQLVDAYGINDSGAIVGSALNIFTGQSHAFALTLAPIPEPETYAMMLAGLGLLVLVAQGRKAKL